MHNDENYLIKFSSRKTGKVKNVHKWLKCMNKNYKNKELFKNVEIKDKDSYTGLDWCEVEDDKIIAI